ELREEIVSVVLRQGGHLASSLGCVELTLALLRAFTPPNDKIVFDVGHQAYAYKLLTGRRQGFQQLRQAGGVSGFSRMSESEYDAFTVGHASTAISAAVGMARARRLMGGDSQVVAVVGDGAMTGGMCYEALNDAGQAGLKLIVVLNDNEMSIAPNVGALARHLGRVRQTYAYKSTKRAVKFGLSRLPAVGKPMVRGIQAIKGAVRRLLLPEPFFGPLGFDYQGPIDGHDIRALTRALQAARDAEGPVLLHVVTQKGRGYRDAERRPDRFHGVTPALIEPGESAALSARNGAVAAGELIALAERDIRVAVVTAAMPDGTGMAAFGEKYPGRLFDVGIAEEHMVTMAAGMAAAGMRPYVAVYSTFLQRAYDQVAHDVCLPELPVTFLIDRAGLVGADGATHQGVYDIGFLSQLPGIVVAAPRDVRDLKRLIALSARLPGPMAIRYPKDGEDLGCAPGGREPLEVGQWEQLAGGGDVMILAVGSMVRAALRAAMELSPYGVSCGVIDARFIKPLDEGKLVEAAAGHMLLVTIEEGAIAGGFGAAVLTFLAGRAIEADVLTLGVPDRFIEHGAIEDQQRECGLTPPEISRAILRRLKGKLLDADAV
ncbi:MAG: 1-deoxy-D-xylulose-5-phosphate synthase, partial [Clostridiales bacterium]|nr:1-deoxy-D-xylulose-5-phosphate synthase [Clostridiales bacterium]